MAAPQSTSLGARVALALSCVIAACGASSTSAPPPEPPPAEPPAPVSAVGEASATSPSAPAALGTPATTPTLAVLPTSAAFVGGGKTISAANASKVTMLWEQNLGGWGHSVAVSSKLGLAVGERSVHELASGKLVGRLTASSCKGGVDHGVAFGGDQLLVVCENTLELFDPRQLTKLKTELVHPEPIKAVAFAWPRVALAHDDGVIRIHQLDGKPTVEIPVPGPPITVRSLALSPDGRRLAVSWVQGSVWWWEVDKPALPHKLARYSTQVNAMAFDAGGTLLAEEGPSFSVAVWDFAGGTPKERAQLEAGRQSWSNGLRFTRDGKAVIAAGSSSLSVSELSGTATVEISDEGSFEDLAMDEQGAVLVTIDRDGKLRAWGIK